MPGSKKSIVRVKTGNLFAEFEVIAGHTAGHAKEQYWAA